MARTQFTFTFTNAQPGASVHFSVPVYADASTPDPDGPTLVLSSANAVSVWADAGFLTAITVDGNGRELSATATAGAPSVTVEADEGTAGTSPFGNGGSTPLYYLDLNHNSSAANYFAWESIPLKSNGVQIITVATPLLTIAPGGGIAEPELIMPAFLSGSVDVQRFELDVSNAGGTEKVTWETTALGTLAASSDTFVDLSTATTFDVIGSDITWDAVFGGPISAAGGQFMVKALLLLSITNLA